MISLPIIEMARTFYEDVHIEPREGIDYLVAIEGIIDVIQFDMAEPARLLSLVNLVQEPDWWTKGHLTRSQLAASVNQLTTRGESPDLLAEAAADEQWWRQTSSAWVPAPTGLKWCTEHGLPEFDTRMLQDNGMFQVTLRLQRFQEQTLRLYLSYQLWRAVCDHDASMIDRYLLALTPSYLPKPSHASLIHKMRDVTDLLSNVINRHIPPHPGFAFRANIPGFLWLVGPAELFGVAYLELALLITRGRSEVRQHIKRCSWCQSLFWGHKNRQHCPQCDRRTVHSRIKRSYGPTGKRRMTVGEEARK